MHSLESLFNSIDAGVLFIDSRHCIKWANKKAEEWFEPLEIDKKRACYRTMAYSDSFCAICPTGRTIDYGIPTYYEFKLPNSASKKKPSMFEVIGIPIISKDNYVSMVMELVIDTTKRAVEKIKSEEIMCHIEKMAAVGQLAAGVAHELNTPLATISLVSQELKCIMDEILGGKIYRGEVKDYLADIESEIKRCKKIVEDLLNFSQKAVYELVETDINNLLPKIISLIQKGNNYKDVDIQMDLDKFMPVVKTDPERFKQVLFNVLKNAVEAVIDKIDKADGEVVVATSRAGGFIKTDVRDNGIGISDENLKKVFDPFFTTKPPGKGTGLGLSVSYGIMRDLNGDIKINSMIGKGTNVSLLLPIK